MQFKLLKVVSAKVLLSVDYIMLLIVLFTMLKLSERKAPSLPLLQDYNKQEQLTEVIYH